MTAEYECCVSSLRFSSIIFLSCSGISSNVVLPVEPLLLPSYNSEWNGKCLVARLVVYCSVYLMEFGEYYVLHVELVAL